MTIQPVTLRRPIKHHSNTADHLLHRRSILVVEGEYSLFQRFFYWLKLERNTVTIAYSTFFRSKGEWQDGEGGGEWGGGAGALRD